MGDAYEAINGGYATALTEITNQSVDTYGLSASTSSTHLASVAVHPRLGLVGGR